MEKSAKIYVFIVICVSFFYNTLYADTSDVLKKAINFHYNRDYENSLLELSKVKINDINQSQVEFFKLCNLLYLNKPKDCLKQIEYIENFVPILPERYKVLVPLIKNEVEQWSQEEKNLEDISRQMRISQDRLKNGNAGKITKKIQDDIVRRLDKIIEGKEKKNNEDSQSAANKQQNQPQNPADKSEILPGDGTGEVLQKKMQKFSQSWGSLPPRERAKTLQELTAGLHPRYRESIQRYFELLASHQPRR